MSNTKFTEGPWAFDKRGEHLENQSGQDIVIYHAGLMGGAKTEESVANSTLIKASPLLYKALEEALRILESIADDTDTSEVFGFHYDSADIGNIEMALKSARGE